MINKFNDEEEVVALDNVYALYDGCKIALKGESIWIKHYPGGEVDAMDVLGAAIATIYDPDRYDQTGMFRKAGPKMTRDEVREKYGVEVVD